MIRLMMMQRRPMRDKDHNQLAIPTAAKSGLSTSGTYRGLEIVSIQARVATPRSSLGHKETFMFVLGLIRPDRTILSFVGFMFLDVHKYVRKGAKT